jgi:Xaa-Pro aminopeptidase
MELGALHQAYPPIVAGGERALGLHYTENNKQIKSGHLLLIDAACEYNHYTADITRTYPVDGKFSREQAALYDLVLYAQQSAIEVIKPNTPYKLIHDTAVSCLVAGLIDLNILTGSLEDNILKQTYKKFYPHSTGHWLGLDVHDVGNYTQGNSSTLLSANMLLTVEPGLYIYPDNQVDEKWHNIGIRIEDDVLVSSVGHEVLSDAVPKTRIEVEKSINSNAKYTCVIGSGC